MIEYQNNKFPDNGVIIIYYEIKNCRTSPYITELVKAVLKLKIKIFQHPPSHPVSWTTGYFYSTLLSRACPKQSNIFNFLLFGT
jgi:hypothetical protein